MKHFRYSPSRHVALTGWSGTNGDPDDFLYNLLDVDNDAIEEGMQVTVDFEDIEEGVSLPVWRPA